MKIIIDDEITIFLSKPYMKNLNLKDKYVAESLIRKLNYKYNIDLYGYIDVKIYIDKNYGVIINIKKDELDYIDYFNIDIEMNIEIIEDSFLYKIDNIFYIKDHNNFVIYKYKENLYLKPEKISNINLGKILENSKIIYGEQTKKILSKSKIIKPEVIL